MQTLSIVTSSSPFNFSSQPYIHQQIFVPAGSTAKDSLLTTSSLVFPEFGRSISESGYGVTPPVEMPTFSLWVPKSIPWAFTPPVPIYREFVFAPDFASKTQVATVSEPSSLALVGLILAGLVAWKYLRKAS